MEGAGDELSRVVNDVNRGVDNYEDCIYRRNVRDEHSGEYLLLEVEALQLKMALMRRMDELGDFLGSCPNLTENEKSEVSDCMKRIQRNSRTGGEV